MKDLFDKCYGAGGYFPMLREVRDRYFVMPKLEGRPAAHMSFEGRPVVQWTLNNYLSLADRPGRAMGPRNADGFTLSHGEHRPARRT